MTEFEGKIFNSSQWHKKVLKIEFDQEDQAELLKLIDKKIQITVRRYGG